MTPVSLVRYSPATGDLSRTAQLIECYRDVFADKPWHEWLKCAVCGTHWGVKDQALLASLRYEHCGQPLVDYWQRKEVLDDIEKEIRPASFCMLALADERVVGFSWGYPIHYDYLEIKVGIQFGKNLIGLFGPQTEVGYQDEIGVLPAYRGTKIAKTMNKHRIQFLGEKGLKVVVSRARRTPTASVTYSWYTGKLGYQVLAEYPPEDGRVILGRRIEGLVDLL